MADFERLLPNADDGGWSGGGTFANIDNGILNPSGTFLDSGGNGGTDETVLIDFAPSAIVDADVVTKVFFRIKGINSQAANENLSVAYLGTTVTQAMTTAGKDHFFSHADWEVDRTAVQMDAIQISVTGGQTGMPQAHAHRIDEIECLVVYEPTTPSLGDLVRQHQITGTSGTTLVGDLGRNPTSGNLLVCAISENSALTVSSIPTGFTALTGGADTVFMADWCYKISDGTEQTATYTLSGTIANAMLKYFEFDWDNIEPLINTDEDETNLTSLNTGQYSGMARPPGGGTRNLILVFFGVADEFIVNDDQRLTLEFDEIAPFGGSSTGGIKLVSRKGTNPITTQFVTHWHVGSGNEMYGAIACLSSYKQPPRVSRQMNMQHRTVLNG